MTDDAVYLNGTAVPAPRPDVRLLDWLRDVVGDTSAKEGCGMGQCGACTVLVDDQPVLACCMLGHAARGRRVWTAAGLMATPIGRAVRDTFAEHQAIQCGFCAPGMTVSAVAWLTRSDPGVPCRRAAAEALSGNICRCGGYGALLDALLSVARCRRLDPGVTAPSVAEVAS
jgi:carbon-monoxide dehydrogenase small subunit